MTTRALPPWSLPLLALAVLVALLLASCSSARARPPRDSPAWRGCKAACEAEGKQGGMLVEDDDHLTCLCAKGAV